jgi:hypothetical protein
MANDPLNPEQGDVHLDGEEFRPYIEDLPPGGLQGMLTAQPNFIDVLKEILANQALYGAKAGVTADDFADLETTNARITRLDVFIRPAQKFVEMLIETRYLLEDRRQRLALNIAQSVDRRALRDPQLLAKYEKTRAYRSAAAKKGLKTRRKNAEPAPKPAPKPESKPETTRPTNG